MLRTSFFSFRKRRTGRTPYVVPAFGSVSMAGSGTNETSAAARDGPNASSASRKSEARFRARQGFG